MSIKKKYLSYVDIAKGIAIIAVVIGHCFPDNLYLDSNLNSKTIAKYIFDFCYLWHMPVFFFISGFLFYNNWKEKDKCKLVKKAKRLLIPYLTFSVLYIPLRLFMSNMANSQYTGYWKILIGISPNGGVWYLYSLFVFMVMTILFFRNQYLLSIIVILGGISNVAIHTGLKVSYSVLKYTMLYYVFFGLGILWQTVLFEKVRTIIINNRRTVIETILFIFLFIIIEFYNFEFLSLICGIIGIDIVLYLSRKINNRTIGDVLQKLGKRSMAIYLLHGPILVVIRYILIRLHISALFASMLMFILGLLFSIMIDKYFLHLNRYIELLFLGVDKNMNREYENVEKNLNI